MTRQTALNLIKQHVKTENSIKHMLAAEAIMRTLARHLNQDEEVWGIAGLLHDLDMEIVDYRNEPEKHGIVSAQMLKEQGVSEEIINAVKAHNEMTGKTRDTLMEKAIYSVDPLTGLIVAGSLVLSSKKLADLKPESILKRMKEKAFARGASREAIRACQEFGMSLEEFVEIGVKAMQGIAGELGL